VIFRLAAAAIAVVAAAGASAAEKADPCKACHGETGNSAIAMTPSLAGHSAAYTTLQLILFRERQRRDDVMMPLAADLSDEDIVELAAFFAAQTPQPVDPPAADEARVQRGKSVADARHCGSCHLPDYSGREQMARLAGQREDYLVKAMTDYRDGRRAGLDGMMTGLLRDVGDDDIATLAHFLANQR
jgi:cytochrome c553